tara:strand:+ start:456 stop:1076 length:621 start_codon:yes stop_codon:yes gene_type:complete
MTTEEKEWQKFHKVFPVYALMSIETRQDIFSTMAENAVDGMVFVETGIFTGGSFCFLGNELKKRNKQVTMHAVDNFLFENISKESEDEVVEAHGEEWRGRYYDLFLHNLETYGLTEMTEIHAMDSIEASKTFEDESIDFIHFDGSHASDYVKAEISAWLPKLKENSVIAGHDYPALYMTINSIFGNHIQVVNDESYIVKLGNGFIE